MNTKSPLFKYQLGLLVLGLATVALFVFVVMQGSSSRQDNKTNKAAQEIASKLNDYIIAKSRIPDSLQETGAAAAPKTITYEKLGDESYRFCATYKAGSDSIDTPALFANPLTGGYYDKDLYGDAGASSYLYISDSYKKGENCQTVTPYIYSSDTTNNGGSNLQNNGTGPYFKCGQSYNYYLFSQPIESITADEITTSGSFGSTYKLDPNVKVFTYNCDAIALSAITASDSVSLYFNPYGSPITTIVKEN